MLQGILEQYFAVFPEERDGLSLLARQVDDQETLNDRKNFRGHVTGAGIVLSPDHSEILLVHHKASGLWLQPGGHMDAEDRDPLQAAKREVLEETGVGIQSYLSLLDNVPLVPLHIETHYIEPRPEKGEPEHYHHDFRYVFVAGDKAVTRQVAEIHDAVWVAFNDDRLNTGLSATLEKLQKYLLKQLC